LNKQQQQKPCLYCGGTEHAKTLEHVLQAGLGGSLKLVDEVCGDCNSNRFSAADKELIRFAKTYLHPSHPDVDDHFKLFRDPLHLWFDERAGVWVTVRFGPKLSLSVLPQLVLTDSDTVYQVDPQIDPSGTRLFEKMVEELSSPTALSITRLIVRLPPKEPCPVQRAVIRSARNVYAIRACSKSDAEELEQKVRRGDFVKLASANPTERRESFTNKPTVQMRLSIGFGLIRQAVGKTAVNFVCSALDPALARSPELAALRQEALEPRVSSRLVRLVFDESVADPMQNVVSLFAKPGHHTIAFHNLRGLPIVFLILYQQYFGSVQLTRRPTRFFPELGTVVGQFDYSNRTHQILDSVRQAKEFARTYTCPA